MAFQEAGDRPKDKSNGGIKLAWYRLEDYECPSCGDDLKHFEHIDMWKCLCGFKIGNGKLLEIVARQDEQNFSSGFRFGGYQDETPF